LRFSRVRLLFGDDFDRLVKKRVLVLGVGGVGGVCLESLLRSGLKDVTIVDFDTFETSNQNRQLGSENIGMVKVEYFKNRYPYIEALNEKIDDKWCSNFDFDEYDLVIDAIDDIDAKVALANSVKGKLISSMGSAKRVDPTKIDIDSIWNTKIDPFAKKFRYELKKSGFDGDFKVVYSTENPMCKDLGSFMGVTGSFGFALSSLAIRELLS